jgi:hypothetical protein
MTHALPRNHASTLEERLARTAPRAHAAVHDVFGQKASDPSAGKTYAQTCVLLNCGATMLREKVRDGVLPAWSDGANIRISTPAIYEHLLDLIEASNPVNGPPPRGRTPSRPFRKGHRPVRPRTPRELEGLAKGNARRHAEAVVRREAKGP